MKKEFAEQLPQRLDIVAFADDLAVHNLLANNDSLAGMGNNYYLYYDYHTSKSTPTTCSRLRSRSLRPW
jgi:spore coat protein CotH